MSLKTARALTKVTDLAKDLRAALGPPGPMQRMVTSNLGGALQSRLAPRTLATMNSYTIIYKMDKDDHAYPWVYVDLQSRDFDKEEDVSPEHIHLVSSRRQVEDTEETIEVTERKVIDSMTLQGTIQRVGQKHDINLGSFSISRLVRDSDHLIYLRGAVLRGRPSEIFREEDLSEQEMYSYLLPISNQLSTPETQRILNRIST